ncbi:spindle pole body component 98 isoform X2 [Wolffia australiana]
MEDPKTLDLIKELVLRLIAGPSSSADLSHPPADFPRAVRFAMRLLSSRISPSAAPDDFAMAESLKRDLVRLGRPSDALAIADLLSKLSAKPGPGSIRHLWPVLYLLRSLSKSRSPAGHPTLSCYTALPLDPPLPRSSRKPLFLAKDGDTLREIALREYAELVRSDSAVPESALVRDLLFIAQGIDGKLIRYNPSSDGYDLPDSLPPASRTVARRLCELGWLFRKVHGLVASRRLVGAVAQAFAAGLDDELAQFYKLLAVLDAHAARPAPEPGYLSLRRLAVWLAEPLHRLRLMAVLADACGRLRGGAMAGTAHALARHGDPAAQALVGRLLGRLCAPLFAMVKAWVLRGELCDPHSEFFVVVAGGSALWRSGYLIEPSMVPSFISPELAGRILRAGKSINFLRAWTGGLEEGGEEEGELEAMVDEAARRTDRRLLELFNGEFRFREHCLAIKRYLLLGQGDFVQRLLDLVAGELCQPAKMISVFHLSGLLESAIRGSNAQYDDADILGRIKVRMMAEEGEMDGWDVFSLEYEARAPLDAVFSGEVMGRYLKEFNFLVKLRRVEMALVGVWRKGGGLGRRWQALRSEMSHFVNNLQCYIMFEVLEVTWAKFVEEMEAARDLDRLIDAHERYLDAVLEKSLLGERSREINTTLFDLLDIILKFGFAADRRCQRGFCPSLPRGKRKSKQKKRPQPEEGVEQHSGRTEELETIAREYSTSLKKFISQLPAQRHVDLKFLLFRLDFTEFYSSIQG